MRSLLLVLGVFSMVMNMSCGDGNVTITTDPAIQAAEDSATIVNYLFDLGYEGDEVNVTESGVRYVILDTGNGDFIDESDIVTFDYIGKLLTDTIFDTSIQEIADSIRLAVQEDTVGVDASNVQLSLLNTFSESREFEPFEITYSASGWPIEGQFIAGFTDGVSATFNKMNINGSALIVIPSAEAYGTVGSGLLIPPNTVISFEFFPIEVIKQPPLED
ncbi:MAG: FKBP-type peptidyl-prolyl cis-trans isomerase [Bacteroidota bacterium]